VLYPDGVGAPIPPRPKSDSFFGRAATVLAGALLLAWPALFNRYPLLYPDSITYIADGRPVARALFMHQFSDYYGMRSFLYSLGIFPFHWNVTPWPIVGLHALLAAYVLWLVVRSIVPQPTVSRYLLLVALLSLLSSLSWFVSLILPDVLGGLLYLSIYLLVFARDTLSRQQRLLVAIIAGWAAASHVTHLILAAGLCVLLCLLRLLRSPLMANRMKAVGEVAMVLIVSAASQLALHAYLYGKPSLAGDAPPFLAARLIADGPGRWYLQQHCGEAEFALCDYLDELPDSSDEFLWNPHGVWATAVQESDDRIRQEEMPFVLATLRAYPREEFFITAAHFWQQLSAFGLWDLDRNEWVLEAFDTALPGGKPGYLNSWQAADDLPLDFFSAVQYWTVIASLPVLLVLLFLLRHRPSTPLLGLNLAILPTLVANALVTSALSNVEERYQSRLIWLLPFLAAILLLHWLDRWHHVDARHTVE
jgi:hypothetical protein